MQNKDSVLGIDTSNYKTSLAVVDRFGNIIYNHQRFLDVKNGERGLRQSEAFFQHEKRLPEVITEVLSDESLKNRIAAVSVSVKPRPVEGSYMPVFTAGHGFAKVVAAALNVPLFEFSHQEGHIEAIRFYSTLKESKRLICFHFSGGTTEAVLSDQDEGLFEIVGGTKDIAFGQVLDRVGVSLGYDFPCGAELDRIAMKADTNVSEQHDGTTEKNGFGSSNISKKNNNIFTKIKVSDGFFNLSGIETQAQNYIGNQNINRLVRDLFDRLSETIVETTVQLSRKYDVSEFVFAGGVASSEYIRQYISYEFEQTNSQVLSGCLSKYNIAFGSSQLASDNAVGIALLGGKALWH